MSLDKKVEFLLDEFLDTRTDLFLIAKKISKDNRIEIIIDGDQDVSIQDCLDCSRAIENNLDREEEDFELSVLSSGLSNPLTLPRQYIKNIGRELKITLEDKTIEGKILNANEEEFVLQWEERRPKLIGKGKETIRVEEKINYNNIKKAEIVLKF